ncbi:MAG: WS/DGAT domain-containing protein, partial [Actinomycetota bacterium]|nr:WS/DGAT domain-containing protein [Actinomycetota bacterium]
PGAAPPAPPVPPVDDLAPAGPFAEAFWRSLTVARDRLPALAASAREVFSDPHPRAQATVDLVRSVARLASPSDTALSPVMTGRSLASHLGAIDLDLDRAGDVGREAGGTINDVFVAGLLEGLRLYHVAHGRRPEALRIGVPINLRTDDTDAGVSNAFAPARIAAPLQILDPSERIATVHRLVLSERHQPAHDIVGPLAGVVHRLPMARAAMSAALGSLDAMASNVPGPPVPLWLGRAGVTGMYPYGPRSGAGLNVTLLSHERTARIGVHADPAATPDGDVLVAYLRDGLAATLH